MYRIRWYILQGVLKSEIRWLYNVLINTIMCHPFYQKIDKSFTFLASRSSNAGTTQTVTKLICDSPLNELVVAFRRKYANFLEKYVNLTILAPFWFCHVQSRVKQMRAISKNACHIKTCVPCRKMRVMWKYTFIYLTQNTLFYLTWIRPLPGNC